MRQQRIPRKRRSMACPSCGKLVSINAEKCIHCGHWRPGRFVDTPVLRELMSGQVTFANGITLICFLLFALAIGLDASNVFNFTGIFDILSPSSEALYKLGMGGRVPFLEGRWWAILTGTYLHGSVLHIMFNMMWLRQIGPLVEELYGNSRFLILYTISGLAGGVLTTVMGTSYYVGASGAIFGLFGALIYYGWSRGGTFGSGLLRRMITWAGFGLIFGFIMPRIDNWGHAGGLVGGLITAWLLSYQERKKETLNHHSLALLVLGFILVCFGFMVFSFVKIVLAK